jgi:hypothetical protein
MSSSNPKSSKKAEKQVPTEPIHQILSIVSARDYVPGKEHEVLEAVQSLLVSSTKVVYRKMLDASKGKREEQKKCGRLDNLSVSSAGTSDTFMTPNEMDVIMDSMTYVCEFMESYHTKANNAANKFMEEQKEAGSLVRKVDQINDDSGIWNLGEVAKDFSTTDFILGSLADEYPLGSKPILNRNTYLGPTADMFLGSLTSLLGVKRKDSQIDDGNLLMDSRLRYLEDVNAVSNVCKTQLRELDTILSNQGLLAIEDKKPKQQVEEFDTLLTNEGLAMIFELDDDNTMVTNDTVKTRDVEDKAHPPALSYIQAARDKLAEYSGLAQKILKDEVKCMVSEYTCTPADTTTSDKQDGLFFEPIRSHFSSNAYNMNFKTYLAEEASNEMQAMLLDTLHSSKFLRNVGDKCQQQVRLHVGQEVSVSICNVVMDCLMKSKEEHRVTEWGACLFKRHVQALHAYVFEFCQTTEGTEDLLAKVNKSSLDVLPMDTNWERLFYSLDILKLESLEDYSENMLHPLCTSHDARKILRLRTEFDDDAIRTRVFPSKIEVDERILG